MAFCAHCGRELPAGAVFCPSCGTAVTPQQRQETELDRLTKDSGTQEYWLRRVFTFVIDLLVVSVIEFFIAAVVFFPIFLATGIFFPLASLGFFLNLLSPLSLLLSGFTAVVLLTYFTHAGNGISEDVGEVASRSRCGYHRRDTAQHREGIHSQRQQDLLAFTLAGPRGRVHHPPVIGTEILRPSGQHERL